MVGRRPLGRTGLTVSEIGFGCGPTAGLLVNGEPQAQQAAVALALSLGIDYFDTAPGYGDARSESNLGRVLSSLGATASVGTKVALELQDLADIGKAVTDSVERSVSRLRRPITLIQLHNRVGARRAARAAFGSGALLEVGDVLGPGGVTEAFERLRDRGLVRALGCSGYGGNVESVRQLIASERFDVVTLGYSALNPSAWFPLRDAMDMRDDAGLGVEAETAGMGIVLLRALEAGLLASDEPPPAGSATGAAALEQRQMARRAPALRRHLLDAGIDPAQGGIRFALSQPAASTVLVGISSAGQVREAAAASVAGPLRPDLVRSLLDC